MWHHFQVHLMKGDEGGELCGGEGGSDTNNSNKNKLAEIVYDATIVTALSDFSRHL